MGAGCDPAAKGYTVGGNKTALDCAKENNKPRMAALLEAAAACGREALRHERINGAISIEVPERQN